MGLESYVYELEYKLKDQKIEIETLKNELKECGLRLHAEHSEHGSSFHKFVEGNIEKLIEDWKECKFTFCVNRYKLVYGGK